MQYRPCFQRNHFGIRWPKSKVNNTFNLYTYLEFGDKIMYATGTCDYFWLTNDTGMDGNGYAMMYDDDFSLLGNSGGRCGST